MSRHVYPRAAAAADLGRAGLGCALALTPLAAASPPPAVVAALLAMLGIFAVMGLRGVLLLFTHIELEAGGVSASDVLGRGARQPDTSADSGQHSAGRQHRLRF